VSSDTFVGNRMRGGKSALRARESVVVISEVEQQKALTTGGQIPQNHSQGAMSEQATGSRGSDSFPQKFLQLVGYRDPSPRCELWLRPTGGRGPGAKSS
jgi:hypothetical protein